MFSLVEAFLMLSYTGMSYVLSWRLSFEHAKIMCKHVRSFSKRIFVNNFFVKNTVILH